MLRWGRGECVNTRGHSAPLRHISCHGQLKWTHVSVACFTEATTTDCIIEIAVLQLIRVTAYNEKRLLANVAQSCMTIFYKYSATFARRAIANCAYQIRSRCRRNVPKGIQHQGFIQTLARITVKPCISQVTSHYVHKQIINSVYNSRLLNGLWASVKNSPSTALAVYR